MDPSGRASFQRLQQSINKGGGAGLLYHVFDLIYIDGYSLVKTPLRDRKRVLAELLEPLGDKGLLRYSDHIEGNGAEFLKEACKYGLEGIVSKRGDSVYEFTRSRNWLKVKCLAGRSLSLRGIRCQTREFRLARLILGVYDHGTINLRRARGHRLQQHAAS